MASEGLLHGDEARHYHESTDPHSRPTWLVDVVLGGQDGLVNVLGLILGVGAATENGRIVLAAGFAAAIAESVSMAAVAYTSTSTAADLLRSERERELRHVSIVPTLERDEIREIYRKKGFSGAILEEIVDTITKREEVWVREMLAEEHGLSEIDPRAALRSAVLVGVSAFVASLVPLAPYILVPVRSAPWASVAISALLLFGFGAYKARATAGRPLRGGIELALIGIVSALAGYAVGRLFQVPQVP